jgi:YHS domain-containing protein
MRVFVQDPETYLNELGVQLACAIDPAQPALIDSAHRISIGYETYFVSGDEAKRRFEADVMRYCGVLTDPVTKERFRPTASSPHTRHDDREYYFASQNSLSMFAAMPDMYADPRYEMLHEPAPSDH